VLTSDGASSVPGRWSTFDRTARRIYAARVDILPGDLLKYCLGRDMYVLLCHHWQTQRELMIGTRLRTRRRRWGARGERRRRGKNFG